MSATDVSVVMPSHARPRIDNPWAMPAWRDIVQLTKPSISLMSVIVGAGSMVLAERTVTWPQFGLTMIGLWAIVAAAGAFNMLIERDVDGLMVRTRTRPLPAGRCSGRWAIVVGTVCFAIAMAALAALPNLTALYLSVFSFFCYVCVYTPMKRTSLWSLPIGSVPGAMPALIGYAAAAGEIDRVGLALAGVMFFWQIPHFLAISIYRAKEYTNAGYVVAPARYGMDATRALVIGTSVPLAAVSVALWAMGVAGAAYGVVALMLSIWFLSLTLQGLRATNVNAWARRVFLGTLVYQVVLFAALAIDVGFSALVG